MQHVGISLFHKHVGIQHAKASFNPRIVWGGNRPAEIVFIVKTWYECKRRGEVEREAIRTRALQKRYNRNTHLKVAFCSTGSRAGSMCSVISSISSGLPTLMQFSKDLSSFAFVIVVTCCSSKRTKGGNCTRDRRTSFKVLQQA